MKLTDLISENGKLSTIRVMCMACCVNAIAISIIGLFKSAPDYSGMSILCGTFLAAAMGGKIMHKQDDQKPISKAEK